ncbi:choice-of-anchor M domain-containing protein [Nakamurella leprariae]|uniref:Choice-of-anchor M domain-containing protein n=1 Tax=Nakamurella leprariae TaxID=2803911 RepID=A0A939C112_9ACTN|nr:choice-of-anchor M domain-containing protein [Nakamurella leprariae]MBM9469331.1 choice-of-anchor M domain-containing protein [Nakamurella leprariae]
MIGPEMHRRQRRPAWSRWTGRAAFAPLLAAALLFGTSGVGLATPTDGLDQTLSPDEVSGTGRAVLDSGHVDIGPRWQQDRMSIQIHDDTAVPSVWRQPSDVVMQVGDAATLTVPDDPAYEFLGTPAGAQVYVVPQTQQADVVWVGWNTQDPAVMERATVGATFTMHGVEGPGEVIVFLQSGNFGAPEVLWNSRQDGPQDLFVATNTHTHANWVFTEPGVYLVDLEISADLSSGEVATDRAPLRFAVGSGTDVDAAFTASLAAPDGQALVSGASTAVDPLDADATDPDGGFPTGVVVWVGVAVVVVVAGGLLIRSVLAQRTARREAAVGARRDDADPHP